MLPPYLCGNKTGYGVKVWWQEWGFTFGRSACTIVCMHTGMYALMYAHSRKSTNPRTYARRP